MNEGNINCTIVVYSTLVMNHSHIQNQNDLNFSEIERNWYLECLHIFGIDFDC